LFDKFENGDFIAIEAIKDLTFEEYKYVYVKVINDCKKKVKTTQSGAFIVRPSKAIAMRYIKELLRTFDYDYIKTEEIITYSNSFKFSIFPNPVSSTSIICFNMQNTAKVSAEILDLEGKTISICIKEQMLNAGKHEYPLGLPSKIKGNFLVRLWVNNVVNVQLITKYAN